MEKKVKLRKLQTKDAELMLEWMHDESVVRYLRADFTHKTIADCLDFIISAQDESESVHMAIVDCRDEYMGTVSLKHIQQDAAELGIVLRSCAMGRGYAAFGMREILEYGFRHKGIRRVYWCVDSENKRAIRFYDKNGYQSCDAPHEVNWYTAAEKHEYLWYSMQR